MKDCLNSILFPETCLIYDIQYIGKEILSNSHIQNKEGTRIVDSAFLAKIIAEKKDDDVILKDVVLDIEMEKGKISDAITQQCFDCGTGLRYENDFKETWVIAFCIDDPQYFKNDKNAKCYVKKEFKNGPN